MQKSVSIRRMNEYDEKKIEILIRSFLSDLQLGEEDFKDKKIVIKPNFVSPKNPEKAATTHPMFIEAVANVLASYHPASLILAESSGGPYTSATLKNLYRTCGVEDLENKAPIRLNFDTDFLTVSQPEGHISREFQILKPLAEADVVVDLCKLKTHTLTKMSCATKNFFGSIPGIHKFEMHARFPEQKDFQNMLLDLSSYFYFHKKLLCICDAVEGMEGNGPTNGIARHLGLSLASTSPYALDIVAEHLLGFDGTVTMCDYMAERSLTPRNISEIEILGEKEAVVPFKDWKAPDSSSKSLINIFPNLFGGRLVKFFSPRPVIHTKKCVGCGKCAQSCPVHTIEIVEEKGKKKAHIHPEACIHCFCCQELCPFDSVKVKKNGLISIIH